MMIQSEKGMTSMDTNANGSIRRISGKKFIFGNCSLI